jgi:PEP-CTERM motif
MKKSIPMAGLALTVSMVASHGQGYIAFNSYSCNGGAGALAASFGDLPGPLVLLSSDYSADLYYAFGTVLDPVTYPDTFTLPAPGFTDLDIKGVTFSDGYFEGPTVIIPGYVSGPISFEVVAFNGSSYANSAARGRSSAFTESMIANSASSSVTLFGDNGPGMPNLYVNLLPEPTTLTLAGLGGLVSLFAFRRKQA